MKIHKNQKFEVGLQRVIAVNDIYVNHKDNGYFILNMWT